MKTSFKNVIPSLLAAATLHLVTFVSKPSDNVQVFQFRIIDIKATLWPRSLL